MTPLRHKILLLKKKSKDKNKPRPNKIRPHADNLSERVNASFVNCVVS